MPRKKIKTTATTTIDPVAVATGAVEYTDLEGLRVMFGLRRAHAYSLLKDGLIRGVSIRRRGKVRGRRLFEIESVRELIKKEQRANGK